MRFGAFGSLRAHLTGTRPPRVAGTLSLRSNVGGRAKVATRTLGVGSAWVRGP